MKDIKNIAVINLGYIGDVINASPVCQALKQKYNNSQLTFITINASQGTAKQIPSVDQVLIYDRRGQHKGIFNLFKTAYSYKKYKFDLVIVLDNNLRSALFAWLLGAKYRLGRSGEGRSLLLTHTIPHTTEEQNMQIHITEHYMRVLQSLGLYTPNTTHQLAFSISPPNQEAINKLLEKHNVQNKKLLGLCTCTRNPEKNWSVTEASKFIELINKHTDYTVIFIGDNSPVTQEFTQGLDNSQASYINLAGQTTIGELGALINKFNKFISVDTGPMHLALANQVPSICLFFFDIFKKWGPQDLKLHKIIYNGLHQPIKAEEVFNSLVN